ncbi:LysR family transcriptional regulator [Coraliomargarita sp. SDUM461003]|uniref:LysR family transcriptional regulator n=1 Tax=Thalassobacterium maritimum TaxID=3041265 RepID=A0ABU1AT81_9BACT|nr:LysR family transcriptional regulator [Coraliomargarita sp. SDUM461003]MDQ8207361.1 LysR family transcriptional regulator [Coraliomargarita sp. SDUM461003]
MELRLLRTFVAVAELKNFSAAARVLNTVQPAVSRQIADLEDELGVSLFWRSTREVKVTAAGEMLWGEAVALLAHEQRAKALVQRAARGEVGRLRIAYMGSACAHFIPQLVRAYTKAFPEVQVSLVEMTVQQQLDAFNADLIDIGFSRPLPQAARQGFAVEQVYVDTLMAVLPAEHRLAGETELALGRLIEEPFVLFQRSQAMGLFDQIISACEREGLAPRIVSEPESMQMLVTEVAAGLGVSIVPSCVRRLFTAGCVFIPLRPQNLSIATELHYRAEAPQPAVEAFVALTLQARQDIEA